MMYLFPYRAVTLAEIKKDLLSQLEVKNIKDDELFTFYIPCKVTVNYKNHEWLNKYSTLYFYIHVPKLIYIFNQEVFDLFILQATKESINIFLQDIKNSVLYFYIKDIRLTHHQDFVSELIDKDTFHVFSSFSDYYNKIVYKLKNISENTQKLTKYLALNPIKINTEEQCKLF